MDKTWRTIFLATVITLSLVALLFYIDSTQKTQIEETSQDMTEERDKTPFSGFHEEFPFENQDSIPNETEIEKADSLKQTAWIPPWDYKNGLDSLDQFESKFHSISPVTFQINNDGTLTPRLDSNLGDLKKIAQEKNILLIPTISNFDSNMMKNIFSSKENTQKHILSILQVIKNNDYDGIDLDYESIKSENKEDFLNFIKLLSIELKKEEKILSVTVLPKWGEGVVYTGLKETRDVQDWEFLGEWADEVRIMAYDFTPVPSSKAGPIAPIDWVEKILEYAVEKIPNKKIWLGIHLYSYEWVVPSESSQKKEIKTNSYTYNVIKNKVLIHDYVQAKYNTEYKEGYAEYTCLEDHTCILYYATPESVKTRQEIAKKYNIAGVAYWRLGGEDELIR